MGRMYTETLITLLRDQTVHSQKLIRVRNQAADDLYDRLVEEKRVAEGLPTNGFEARVLEIRDRGTLIPALAVRLKPWNEASQALMEAAGYWGDWKPVMLIDMATHDACVNPRAWGERRGARTLPTAHEYIEKHWDEVRDGDVIDVRFILGESEAPVEPERYERREAEGQ